MQRLSGVKATSIPDKAKGAVKRRISIYSIFNKQVSGGSNPPPYGISGEIFAGREACSRRLLFLFLRILLY